MALALNGTPETFVSAASATSHTWSYTGPSGSDRRLVIAVQCEPDTTTIDSVTYAGVSLTKHADITGTGGTAGRATIWTLPAPATGANNIVVTLSTSTECTVEAASYTGAHQSQVGTTATAQASSTAPTVDVSSATGEIVRDSLYNNREDTTATAEANQTDVVTVQETTLRLRGSSSQKAGAGTVTMSWTLSLSRAWAIAAVALQPSTGASPQSVPASPVSLDISTVSGVSLASVAQASGAPVAITLIPVLVGVTGAAFQASGAPVAITLIPVLAEVTAGSSPQSVDAAPLAINLVTPLVEFIASPLFITASSIALVLVPESSSVSASSVSIAAVVLGNNIVAVSLGTQPISSLVVASVRDITLVPIPAGISLAGAIVTSTKRIFVTDRGDILFVI